MPPPFLRVKLTALAPAKNSVDKVKVKWYHQLVKGGAAAQRHGPPRCPPNLRASGPVSPCRAWGVAEASLWSLRAEKQACRVALPNPQSRLKAGHRV